MPVGGIGAIAKYAIFLNTIRQYLFRPVDYYRYDHFLQRDTSMLKGLVVEIHEVVIVIRINEIAILLGKNKA